MKNFLKKQRFIILTLIFAIIILAVIFAVFSIDKKTNIMITDYIKAAGWQINENPVEISRITIPNEFDSVYDAYNKIQKADGFNLENYKGLNVCRYTYSVLNHKYSGEDKVLVNVFVYKNEIIAADISSNGKNSFIYELNNTSEMLTQ